MTGKSILPLKLNSLFLYAVRSGHGTASSSSSYQHVGVANPFLGSIRKNLRRKISQLVFFQPNFCLWLQSNLPMFRCLLIYRWHNIASRALGTPMVAQTSAIVQHNKGSVQQWYCYPFREHIKCFFFLPLCELGWWSWQESKIKFSHILEESIISCVCVCRLWLGEAFWKYGVGWEWKRRKIKTSLTDTKHDIGPTITNEILFGCFDLDCLTHLPAWFCTLLFC